MVLERLELNVGSAALAAELTLPERACGMVALASGDAGARLGLTTEILHQHGLATFAFGLPGADAAPGGGEGEDPALLAGRIVGALDWLRRQHAALRVGLFGVGAAAAAALLAAAARPGRLGAVAARGDLPGLAANELRRIVAPTLLIVGGGDAEALRANRSALRALGCRKRLEVVPGAARSFEQPGTLEAAGHLAGAWFEATLRDTLGR